MDSVFDAYYDWHIHTGFMEFSAQMDVLLGLRPDALPRAFVAWLDRLHPDDRATTVEKVETAVRDGGVYRDEYRLRRDDGTYVHVRDRGVVLRDEDGSSSHMVGAIRDVTKDLEAERALHEAAELYRTLFENAVNPTFQIDSDGRFLDANSAGVSFLETSRGQLLRRGVASMWGQAAMDAVTQAARSGVAATLELEFAMGGGVKALTLTLGAMPLPWRRDLFRTRDRYHGPSHPAQGARGIGGLAPWAGGSAVRQQHGAPRHPGAAQPRQS